MNYYISDLHLNHKNVCDEGRNFDNRPFKTLDQMHKAIKDNWNARIKNSDTVHLLGDTVWKVTDEMIGLVSQLRGAKVFICGNHDSLNDSRYRQLFTEICDYKEVSDNINGINRQVVLSHYPIYTWKKQHQNWIHLYGHVHISYEEILYQKALAELNNYYKNRDDDRYTPFYAYNVGCMMPYMGYTPRTLSEIIEGATKYKIEKQKG